LQSSSSRLAVDRGAGVRKQGAGQARASDRSWRLAAAAACATGAPAAPPSLHLGILAGACAQGHDQLRTHDQPGGLASHAAEVGARSRSSTAFAAARPLFPRTMQTLIMSRASGSVRLPSVHMAVATTSPLPSQCGAVVQASRSLPISSYHHSHVFERFIIHSLNSRAHLHAPAWPGDGYSSSPAYLILVGHTHRSSSVCPLNRCDLAHERRGFHAGGSNQTAPICPESSHSRSYAPVVQKRRPTGRSSHHFATR